MTILIAILMVFAPTSLDLPPEGVYAAANPTDQAERLDPPDPPATVQVPAIPEFSDNCSEMHWYRAAAGLPQRFDQIGWRESNCRNEEGVHTSCCYGWWQLNVGLHLRDHRLAGRYASCGVSSRFDVDSDTPGDKMRQACAAKALYDVVGLSAWSTR